MGGEVPREKAGSRSHRQRNLPAEKHREAAGGDGNREEPSPRRAEPWPEEQPALGETHLSLLPGITVHPGRQSHPPGGSLLSSVFLQGISEVT